MTPSISSPQISLRINGTKERRAGFASLMPVGVLFTDDELKGLDRVTMVQETPVYVIRHSADHILYMLVDRHVKSFDADAPGVLTIAISIPKGFKLPGSKSPSGLLRELYNTFRAENMVPMADGFMKYLNKEADENTYRGILNRYQPLEPCHIPYVTMNPHGPTAMLRVASDRIDDFFRDSNYGEFRPFRDIEIGTACATTPGLESLEIPRCDQYRVEVNNKPIAGVALRLGTDSYSTKLPDDPRLYEFSNISFDLQQLIDSGGRLEKEGGVVTLDVAARVVRCQVPVRRRQIELKVIISGRPEEVDTVVAALKSGRLKAQVDYKDRTANLLEGAMTLMLDEQADPHRFTLDHDRIDNLRLERRTLERKRDRNGDYLLQVVNVVAEQPKPVETYRHVVATGGGGNHVAPASAAAVAAGSTDDDNRGSRRPDMMLVIAMAAVGLIVGAVAGYFIAPLIVGDNRQAEEKVEAMRVENENLQKQVADLQSRLDSIESVQSRQAAQAVQADEEARRAGEEVATIAVAKPAKPEKPAAKTPDSAAEARKNILRMVNSGAGISSVRASQYWNKLSQSDRLAVESVLNLKQYGPKKNDVSKLLDNKYNSCVFSSWNELLAARKDIMKITG